MQEQGIIIYQDGTYDVFGKHVCTDQLEYFDLPSHENSFKKEVKDNFNFKLSGLEYDTEKTLYENAIELSRDGVIWIFNNQLTTKADSEILSYVPTTPTEEQFQTLEVSLKDKLDNIKIKQIVEFNSEDLEDHIIYDSFEEYIDIKNSIRK